MRTKLPRAAARSQMRVTFSRQYSLSRSSPICVNLSDTFDLKRSCWIQSRVVRYAATAASAARRSETFSPSTSSVVSIPLSLRRRTAATASWTVRPETNRFATRNRSRFSTRGSNLLANLFDEVQNLHLNLVADSAVDIHRPADRVGDKPVQLLGFPRRQPDAPCQ